MAGRHIHVHLHTADNPLEGTHTEITFPDGSVRRIQKLSSAESMGRPGWHDLDTGESGSSTGSYLGETEEEAVNELVRKHARK